MDDDLQLLIDLHKGEYRQGPGADQETEKAIRLANIDPKTPYNIADIGCGTGASTLTLARTLNCEITAVDFLDQFLEELQRRAEQEGVANKISTLCASMDSLPFDPESFDIIWSEGAIYNIGFKQGISDWLQYLKPGGLLVVSEICWITAERPKEIEDYWNNQYSEIATASAKIRQLEEEGYSPVGYFILPEHCWLDNYYYPIERSFESFLQRNNNSKAAQEIVEPEKEEIELYEKYKRYYSYGMYIARKPSN
ncbi:class I SAM-dependent methyltransferase [Maricurvus nonylphenolicus]|uniref:class I SAM-dependent methyltransferase n=1 Tax=Maricurvus nonylphenolicus TaxID=1008307 RepID=UPI0036F3BDE9